ncbi:hypothetical protein MTR67_042861 [Solanum verrucosum]|uniref:Non-haem dioxygenase N-terminal domain-containing protein n=1 Tax=Solanum verrucosum TaxID=315347 RepID=A0AAF0UQ83_SOLVR|nr:hypothetical protein MTR67_042861 [Solanum verrucosum]
MANIISSKVEALPPTYVFPMHERLPALVPIIKEIPVIDLGEGRTVIAQQLVKALEQYGFFQVTNHGVPEDLMDEAMKVYEEFFNLPVRAMQMKEKHSIPAIPSIIIQRSINIGRNSWNTTVILMDKINKHGLVTLQNIAD